MSPSEGPVEGSSSVLVIGTYIGPKNEYATIGRLPFELAPTHRTLPFELGRRYRPRPISLPRRPRTCQLIPKIKKKKMTSSGVLPTAPTVIDTSRGPEAQIAKRHICAKSGRQRGFPFFWLGVGRRRTPRAVTDLEGGHWNGLIRAWGTIVHGTQ